MNNKPTTDDLTAFDELISVRYAQGYLSKVELERLHPVDPNTGLPSLPEGYFWRVFRNYERNLIALMHRSEVVKEVPTLMTLFTGKLKTVTSETVRQIETFPISDSYTDPVVAIYEASSALLNYVAGNIHSKVRPLRLKSYMGDYPPKNVLKVDEEPES